MTTFVPHSHTYLCTLSCRSFYWCMGMVGASGILFLQKLTWQYKEPESAKAAVAEATTTTIAKGGAVQCAGAALAAGNTDNGRDHALSMAPDPPRPLATAGPPSFAMPQYTPSTVRVTPSAHASADEVVSVQQVRRMSVCPRWRITWG